MRAVQGTLATYYGSRLLASVGQGLFIVTLLVAAGGGRGGALGVSTVLAAMMVAAIALSLPAGALVDRLGPGRGLVLGAALRLGAILSAFAAADSGLVWVPALLYSAASQVFSPAELALVPVVQARAPQRAHAVLVALQQIGMGGGMFVIAPVLLILGGVDVALAAAAIVYAAVTGLALLLARSCRGATEGRGVPSREAFDLVGTLRFFAGEPRAVYAAGVNAFADMSVKSIGIVLPVYLQQDLGLSGGLAIGVAAPLAVGGAIGLVWAGRSLAGRDAVPTMRLVLAGMVVAILAMAVLGSGLSLIAVHSRLPLVSGIDSAAAASTVIAFPVLLLLGWSLGTGTVLAYAVLTETAPRGQRARVFAVESLFTKLLVLLPLLCVGVSTTLVGARLTLVLVAAVGFAVLLLLESAWAPPRLARVAEAVPRPIRP